jgi:hypothetical protein
VRRFLAIALVSIINLLSIMPAFAFAGESLLLPPCCRINGKHKCAMRSASGPALSKIGENCPFGSSGGDLGVASQIVVLHARRVSFTFALRQPSIPAQAETLGRISFSRTHQERGPPSLLL